MTPDRIESIRANLARRLSDDDPCPFERNCDHAECMAIQLLGELDRLRSAADEMQRQLVWVLSIAATPNISIQLVLERARELGLFSEPQP